MHVWTQVIERGTREKKNRKNAIVCTYWSFCDKLVALTRYDDRFL